MPDFTNPVTGEVLVDDPGFPVHSYGSEDGQSAIVAPTGVPGSCGIVSANQGSSYFLRVVPSRRLRVTKIRFRVMVAAGSDDPVDVGIYNSLGVAMVRSGFVSGHINSLGAKEVNLPSAVNLEAGSVYYLAWAALSPTTTAAQVLSHAPGTAECWSFLGTAVPVINAMIQVGSVLPADMSGASAPNVNALPKIAAVEG